MLTDSSTSNVYYNEVLREVESPYALPVTGMTSIQGRPIAIEQSKPRPLQQVVSDSRASKRFDLTCAAYVPSCSGACGAMSSRQLWNTTARQKRLRRS